MQDPCLYKELKQYLSQYDEYSCPDNYFLAWRSLFLPSIKQEDWLDKVLKDAIEDYKEELHLADQAVFDRQRRKHKRTGKEKWNWY